MDTNYPTTLNKEFENISKTFGMIFKRQILSFRFNRFFLSAYFLFMISSIGNAQCTIIGAASIKNNYTCSSFNGCSIIYIGDGATTTTLNFDDDLDLTCLSSVQFIIKNKASVSFGSSQRLYLPSGSSIRVESGGDLSGSNCNASERIYIGGQIFASCNGNAGANVSYADLEYFGGSGSASSNPSSTCIGNNINLSATPPPSGTISSYTWYEPSVSTTAPIGIGQNISITANTAGTHTYQVKMLYDSGTGVTRLMIASTTVTINSNNTVSAGSSNPSLCINGPLTNITYTTSGATGIGTATNLPPGITAVWSSNTITISGTPTASGTFNYSLPLTGGCGTINAAGTVIVNPNNTITLSSAAGTDAQTKCLNSAITNITYSTTGATGATFSGLPTGITGNWTSNTITISGTPSAAGSFTYTITLTGGCGTVTKTGIITINSLPIVTFMAQPGANACAKTDITYTTQSGMSNYSWTVPGILNTDYTITSGGTSSTSNTVILKWLTTGSKTVIINYVNANGCSATSATSSTTTTVKSLIDNIINGFSSSTFCEGTQATITFDANNLSGVPPYTLIYRNDTTNGIATANISSDNTTSFSTDPNPTTSTHYTLISITDANGCINSSPTDATAQVTITPISVGGNVSGNTSVCPGTNNSILTLNGNVGTITKWESSLDNFATTGTPISNTTSSLTATNLNTTTYYRAVVANGICSAVNSSIVPIIVNSIPSTPSIGTITQPTCNNSRGSVILNNLPSSGNWIINTNPGNISGSGSSVTIPNLSQGTYSFTVTDDTSKCTSASTTNVVLNNPAKTWNGSVSTDWFIAENWSPTGIPTENNCVIVPNNPIKVIISGTNQIARANNITVDNGGNLEVTSGNILKLTDFVKVNGGGILTLQNNASLIQVNGNANNSGTITAKRSTAPIVLNDYTYWCAPTSGTQTLANFSPISNPKYFLKFHNTWTYLNSTNTGFDKAIGYAILSPSGLSTTAAIPVDFQFTGTPNNGDISTPVIKDSSVAFSSKLVGNPYPSALDADKFIKANIAGTGNSTNTISGTLYFYTHNHAPASGNPTDNYATYNLTGEVGTGKAALGSLSPPTRWIASGQGFLVKIENSGNIIFTNGMREIDEIGTESILNSNNDYSNANFYKNTNNTTKNLERSRIWLNLMNDNSSFCQALIGYIERASNNYDPGFDGEYNSNGKMGLYSLIGNNYFVIQGRAMPFNNTDIVPIGYRTNVKGNLTISIDHLDGLFSENQDIFLEDKLTHTIHNLKVSPYAFTTGAGTFNDRFVLRYTDTSSEGLNDSTNNSDDVIILSKNQQIKIQSTTKDLTNVYVYDTLGRNIYKNLKINSPKILISDLKTQQVLIVKVILSNGYSVTKKIVNQ